MLQLSDIWSEWYSTHYRLKIAYGGRGGSKSRALGIMILLKGYESPITVLCVRETQRSISESVYKLLCDRIKEDPHLRAHYTIRFDRIIGNNGTLIIFSGIRDGQAVKSTEDVHICWVEEGQMISKKSVEALFPTIRSDSSEIWVSMNPDNLDDPLYKMIINPRKDQLNLNINLTDNMFATQALIDEAAYCREFNPDDYDHIWLGKLRENNNLLVYANSWEELEFEVTYNNGLCCYKDEVLEKRYAVDFGYSDPTCVLEGFMYDGSLYIMTEIYEQGMITDEITRMMILDMPDCDRNIHKIYADGSRPETIDQMNRPRMGNLGDKLPGLYIQPSIKGAGSIKAGVAWLRNLKNIYVHPRCVNTIREFGLYQYKVNSRSGRILDEFLDKDNHAMDTMRYMVNDLIRAVNDTFWDQD